MHTVFHDLFYLLDYGMNNLGILVILDIFFKYIAPNMPKARRGGGEGVTKKTKSEDHELNFYDMNLTLYIIGYEKEESMHESFDFLLIHVIIS